MQPSSGEVRGEMPASASAQMALRDLHGDHRREQMQNPSLHDDFFDQMLSSLPSAWPDHGNPKSPWDADASGAQKLFRIDLTGKQLDESPADNGFATYDESSLLAAQLRESQSSGGSSPTGNTMVLRMSSHHMLPTMGQPPMGAGGGGESGHLPLPLSLGSLGPTDPRLIVEATGDDVDCPYKSPDHNRGEDLYSGFGGSLHPAQAATGPYYQHPPNYVGAAPPAGVGQCPAASATSGGGTVAPKQRVRARRGQATDPHSIAERLRRERIAERMKALQELVPNANKTDKASMLDEIIEYVKFLQLQVKVLSMSRLGGAAAVASLVADLSSEGSKSRAVAKRTPPPPGGGGSSNNNNDDNVTLAEHRVAKLMEEDMGSAMQYLQGKGLCLMPISLASAISSATCRPVAGGDLNPAPPAADAATKGVESPPSPSASALTVQSAATNGASKP